MRPINKILAVSALTLMTAASAYGLPVDGGIGFQEPASPTMEKIVGFHNNLILPIITVITLFVLVLMIYIMFRFNAKANPVPSKTSHNTMIEVVWTVVPVLILLALVVPSMKLLYFQDRLPETDMTIKVTADTWYWEYDYPEHDDINIVSNIVDLTAKEKKDKANGHELTVQQIIEKIDARPAGEPRLDGRPYLLATDAPLVVPVGKKIKALVTSRNNLHSFAVPEFGVKMDAVPGRINETWFQVNKEGTYYGQCSELCGVKHAFMPIEIRVVSEAKFNEWVASGGELPIPVASNGKVGGGMTAAQK